MYSFNEIGLIPAVLSSVSSRSQVNPFIEEGIHQGKLPIFVSPMTSIIDDTSFKVFNKSKVIPIHPRSSSSITPDDEWRAYSLADFEKYFVNPDTRVTPRLYPFKVLIDVANGHMNYIYELVSKAKEYYKSNLIVMIGNIANPETYKKCIEVGVDYVRVCIGGGSICSTSVLTGIHASLPWLITEISKIKETYKKQFGVDTFPKIVADGGINTIDKAIKALALGADYVMMGSTFAKCESACGKITKFEGNCWREYYGMASTKGQCDISGGVNKASEGIISWVKVEYTLEEYLNKFEAALRSCMSYTSSSTLDEFVGKVRYEIMTPTEFNSYYKNETE